MPPAARILGTIDLSLEGAFRELTGSHDEETARQFVRLFQQHAERVMEATTVIYGDAHAVLRRLHGARVGITFRRQYPRELTRHAALLARVAQTASRRRITLVFAARDPRRNNAVVLKETLESYPEAKGAQMKEIIDGLNELMRAERAGAETLSHFVQAATDSGMRTLFEQVRDGEAWSCAGLAECIERLGGARTGERGDFAEKVLAVASLTDRLRLLNRGQRWVVQPGWLGARGFAYHAGKVA